MGWPYKLMQISFHYQGSIKAFAFFSCLMVQEPPRLKLPNSHCMCLRPADYRYVETFHSSSIFIDILMIYKIHVMCHTTNKV